MAADYSDRRRAIAEAMLTDARDELTKLSEDARVMYAIGLLTCDDNGKVQRAALTAAMQDPSIVQAAHNLLTRTGSLS